MLVITIIIGEKKIPEEQNQFGVSWKMAHMYEAGALGLPDNVFWVDRVPW